jgi:RNA polymerase sigma-70 factor (ECF subfamily)
VFATSFARRPTDVHIYWVPFDSDGNDPRGGGVASASGDRLDRNRFAALFAEHHRTLWFIAASVQGDRTQAHDVVQEAAMIALAKLDEFDPATSFVAWMGQFVRYTALNQGRKSRRIRAVGSAPDAHHEPMPFTQAHHDQVVPLVGAVDGFDAELAQAIAMLDEKVRTCLLLRTVRGLSYAAIAAALSLPEGTVMSHVHRAKALLREQMTRAEQSRAAAGAREKGGSA